MVPPPDPMRVPEAERHGCGKRAFGVALTRRGGVLFLVVLLVIALVNVIALLSRG
jgi:hypothetical protein